MKPKIFLGFYKNLISSFSTWPTHLTLRFLYILGCSGPRCAAQCDPCAATRPYMYGAARPHICRRRYAAHERRAWAKHLYKARADRWHLSFYQRCHQTLPLKPPPQIAHVKKMNLGRQKFKYFWNRASALAQGQLQICTEHSTLIFENLKPVEISKNHFNIIWTSSKVVLIFKIRRQRFKN